jgi:tetratricopeptide (TPR) repeat protein
VAEVLAGRLPAGGTSALHPVPAPSLRNRPAANVTSLIAQHYEMAGQAAEAAQYYALAGAHARGLYANVEALDHFRRALALGHPDLAGLHEAIGDLQTLLGDYGAGLAGYLTALALVGVEPVAQAQPPAPASSRQIHLEHKLGMLHLRRGEWELAAGHLRDALDVLAVQGGDDSPSLRSHLYADSSLAAHRQGHLAEAQALAERAYSVAAEAGDRHALAQAENALGMLARGRGAAVEACNHLEASLALVETLSDPALRAAVLNNLALACAACGDRDRALALTESALTLVQTLGDRHREAALHNNLADLLHARGDREAAMRHLKQAVTIFADIRTEADTMQPEIWKLSEW